MIKVANDGATNNTMRQLLINCWSLIVFFISEILKLGLVWVINNWELLIVKLKKNAKQILQNSGSIFLHSALLDN